MAITESARVTAHHSNDQDWVKVGKLALDTRTDTVGVVMSIGLRLGSAQLAGDERIWLRPVGGGREWEAFAEHLTSAPDGTR